MPLGQGYPKCRLIAGLLAGWLQHSSLALPNMGRGSQSRSLQNTKTLAIIIKFTGEEKRDSEGREKTCLVTALDEILISWLPGSVVLTLLSFT